MDRLSERAKLFFLCLLLLLVLGFLSFTTVNAFHAAQTFQKQYSAAKAGDVNAIKPWMTIHVISHIYHVPEDFLYHSLNLKDANALHHDTLYELATHTHHSVSQLIGILRQALVNYHRNHHVKDPPTPTRHNHGHSFPTMGRAHY